MDILKEIEQVTGLKNWDIDGDPFDSTIEEYAHSLKEYIDDGSSHDHEHLFVKGIRLERHQEQYMKHPHMYCLKSFTSTYDMNGQLDCTVQVVYYNDVTPIYLCGSGD